MDEDVQVDEKHELAVASIDTLNFLILQRGFQSQHYVGHDFSSSYNHEVSDYQKYASMFL